MRTMNSDQRREKRAPVDLMLNKYINGEPHLCRAVNLSRGGMLLRKIFEPDVTHHSVMLEFQLPGFPEVIRAEGRHRREEDDAVAPVRDVHQEAQRG